MYSVKGLLEYKMLPWTDERTAIKHLSDWGILRIKGTMRYVLTSELLDFFGNDQVASHYQPTSTKLIELANEIE